MNKNTLLASLVLLSAAGSASESPVSVSHMQAYTAEFEYFLLRDDGSLAKAGRWTDELSVDDHRVVRTVTRMPLGGDVDLVRAVAADRYSLRPLHLTQRFGPGLKSVYHSQFQDDQLTQVLIGGDRTPARIGFAEIPPGVVEVNLQGIFAAGLPLDAGRKVTVDAYRAGAEPAGEPQVFEVIGEESITYDGKDMSAWKVHQPQTDWTYWVRKDPPYLLKVSHPSPAGETLVSFLVSYEL